MQVRLTQRQQQVLWATVRHYIATAEPVGSKALVAGYDLNASSATVRNIMGMLEKGGLLYQPHTSAGRIPSDSGYRIYVDELITPASDLAKQVEQVLVDRLSPKGHNLEAVLRGAAQILSTFSGYISLITMPQALTGKIRLLQLVRVDPKRVMLFVVTDSYETQSALMEIPQFDQDAEFDINDDTLDRELQVLSNFLNHQLQGRSLTELLSLDWQQLDRQFQQYGDFLRSLLLDLTRRTKPTGSSQMLISGVSEVLHQPEFSELQQVQMILQLLEEGQDQLRPLIFQWTGVDNTLDETKPKNRVSIRIGAENPLEPMRMCTLISSTYHRGSLPVGSIGILGPTRMAYDRVIALVEVVADHLTQAISQPA
jgi:heat-inducible transcriptional repressor